MSEVLPIKNSIEPIHGEIIDTTKLCSSFPQVFGAEITRDNVLDTLETFFEGETQVLTVEGSSRYQGLGKTVLLAQFARRNSDRCVSVFIRPTSWFAYDPTNVLRDLCNQISWIVFREEIPSQTAIDDAYLGGLVFELQRHARRQQKNILFVIDGITEIPTDRLQVRDVILSKLPFGLPQFRFVMSGSSADVLKLKMPKLLHKSFTLSPFSLEETVSYFGSSMSREMATEVFKVSHGVPGYLSRVRTLLDRGVHATKLLEQLPLDYPELFEMEWKSVDRLPEGGLELVAVLAHDRSKHTAVELASMFTKSSNQIADILAPLTFLDVPGSEQREIEFISDAYRQYAATKLVTYKERVNEIVIEWLLREPDSEESLSLLPIYFSESGNDEA
jgi:hypothetical protein